MALDEGALITYGIDEVVEVFKGIHTLTDMSQSYDPGSSLQRSANQYWKPVQQQAVTKDGWDITGQADDVLELSIQGSLNEPTSTYRTLRADDLRDETSYRRAINADAKRLLGQMERRGLSKARTHGSFIITDASAFGTGSFDVWDGLAASDARMTETEFNTDDGTCTFLNPTAYKAGGKDLVTSTARMNNNLPDGAYEDGMIGKQVGGFGEVYKHAKLEKFTAQATSMTVNGNQSFAPIATEDSPSGSPVPFDNRFATLPVNEATAGINVGDKFSFAGIKAVSMDEKIELDYDQTFTVVAVNASDLTISPRPIAYDDGALTDLEKAYANISTTISDTDTLVWLNIAARQCNIVMNKDAMVLASSPIPLQHELFRDLSAKEFQVGPINGIIGFESSLGSLTGFYRIALWYEWNVEKPEQIGVILDGQT